MSKFWSPFVKSLVPYVPGEQPKLAKLVKLNTNENPYGPSPKALAAMQTELNDNLRLYPDPNSDLLKNAKNGLVRVVGDGANHWPCVYDRDLADLYVRLAAHPTASGIFHANDEADERVRDIVEAIARHVRVQPDVRHVPMEEARAKMGQYADALALDQIVRSPRARALGWAPTLHSVAGNVAGLIEEFRSGQEAAA